MKEGLLVIEVNKNNLYLMRKVLQKGGFTVIEVQDGLKEVGRAITEISNIIIMDIQLSITYFNDNKIILYFRILCYF